MQSSVFSKLKAYFLQYDVFGEPPSFRILGQQKYNTTLGAFLTIGIFFFAIGYLILGITEIASQEAPIIIQSDRQLIDSRPFQLRRENFTIAITLADINSQPLTTINKYFTMELKNCQTTRIYNETTQTSNVTRNCTVFPLEACTKEHFISQTQIDYFSKIKLGSVQCIQKDFWDQQWPVLQGVKTSSVYQSLTITISQCKNTTNRTTCAPKEEIENNLANGFYAVHMSDSLLQLDRPGNISLDYISLQYNTFSKTTSKQILQQFKMINANTDSGLIFSEISNTQILIQDFIRESADIYNNQYIIMHNINLSSKYSEYNRSYIKLQVILSRVGGLYQLIFLIVTVLIRPFISIMLNIELSNNLFRFHQKNDKNEKEKQIDQNLPDAFTGRYLGQQNRTSHQRNQSNFEQSSKQIEVVKKKDLFITTNLREILLLFFGCAKKKNQMLNIAKQKYMKSLDIKFILQKFQELEQLKSLLLTEDEKILFNFLPKPLIVEELEKPKCTEYDQQMLQLHSNAFQEAFDAFEKVQSSGRQSILNLRLIQSLDPDLQQLFSQVKVNQINNQQLLTDIPLNQSKMRFEQVMESTSRLQENASSQQVYIQIPKKMQRSQNTK